MLTFFLFPQVFQHDKGHNRTRDQSCQYAKHNTHHIVVTDQDYGPNIMCVPINCYLVQENTDISVRLYYATNLLWLKTRYFAAFKDLHKLSNTHLHR